jgi:hypothetical protein
MQVAFSEVRDWRSQSPPLQTPLLAEVGLLLICLISRVVSLLSIAGFQSAEFKLGGCSRKRKHAKSGPHRERGCDFPWMALARKDYAP